MLSAERFEYSGPGGPFEGELCWDASITGPRPGVLVVHAFGGESDIERGTAADLARLGYVGFAIDLYGKGIRATSPDMAQTLMETLDNDRPLLVQRMLASVAALRTRPEVDAARIAAIGYCFGGKAVLDLARSGTRLNAVASVHGVYNPPPAPSARIETPVFVLHGWDDPLGPPESVVRLSRGLTDAGAAWQMHAFGATGHAFTHPRAQAPDRGMQFNPRSADRAWSVLTAFLAEMLAAPVAPHAA